MGIKGECDICGKAFVFEEPIDREYCYECDAWYKDTKVKLVNDAKRKLEELINARKESFGRDIDA